MDHTDKEQLYSNKIYNVKIMRNYVSYLKEKCGWNADQVEHLFEYCDIDVTFLDSDDNWYDQALAVRFITAIQEMTGDDKVAYKAGQFTFSSYSQGIQGRLLQGLASPGFVTVRPLDRPTAPHPV